MEPSRLLPALVGVLALASSTVPIAAAAHHGTINATYAGHASGSISGPTASGSAVTAGHDSLVGKSTFSGSATGNTSSPPCIHFTGTGAIKSAAGTIELASLAGASACIGDASGENGSFTGKARITGGSGKFAHAHGRLSFSGTYHNHAVQITLTGNITY